MNKKPMSRFFNLNLHHDGGFTLVELIVVIAILAILAGVAVPVYSGYIEKANKAGDEQLLAAVNKAFASACLMNGDDIYFVEDVQPVALDGGKIPENAVDPYGAEFWQFYADNSESQFKTFNGLVFNEDTRLFEAGISSSNGITVSKAQVEKILNSSLGKLEAEEIVEMIGTTNDYILAKPMYFDNILADANFAALADKTLGEGGYSAAINAEAAKLAEAAGGYLGEWANLSEDEKAMWMSMQEEQAKKNVGAKVTVLVAAQGASTQKDAVLAGLQNDPNQYVEAIKASMNKSAVDGGDPITGLSQAAVAYGLYSSYITAQGGTPDPVTAWENMKTDTNFHSYLTGTLEGTNVQADMEGFMAAMDTLGSLDSETANKVAQDGVNDAGLNQALKDILGK